MNSISNYLVKTDNFCDYIPVVSSITNLVDLFQKCVVLPFMDKEAISSSHYYKYINEKSFARCFLLIIPVIGNIIIGIYDFSKKKDDGDIVNNQIKAPIGAHKIDISNISLDDVEKIDISSSCAESWPCEHQATVTLKDGRKTSGINSYDICSIVSNLSEERINPGKKWNAKDVKKHFAEYSKSNTGWEPKTPEEVLKNLFLNNNYCG